MCAPFVKCRAFQHRSGACALLVKTRTSSALQKRIIAHSEDQNKASFPLGRTKFWNMSRGSGVEAVQCPTARNPGIPACDFKASSSWTTRLMGRNGLCLRRRMTLCITVAQGLKSKYKISSLSLFRQEKQILLSQIGNTNRVVLNLDMSRSSTVELNGARSVHVKTMGAKKRCMVMLAVTADSRKLPFVVFKRKTLPRNSCRWYPCVCSGEGLDVGGADDGLVDILGTVSGGSPAVTARQPFLRSFGEGDPK